MNDIQYFAKEKGSSESAKLIGWSADKPSSVPVKGLLHYKPSNYYPMVEFDLYYRRHPGRRKEARAFLLGYARVSGIKRTRRRGIERARWMGMTQLEKRRVSMMRRIVKVFASVNGYRR